MSRAGQLIKPLRGTDAFHALLPRAALRLPWALVCNPFGAGLPRCPVVLLNCCLTGITDILLRGDTDVTLSLSTVSRKESSLRHGPGGSGKSLPARASRRTVRADSTEAV